MGCVECFGKKKFKKEVEDANAPGKINFGFDFLFDFHRLAWTAKMPGKVGAGLREAQKGASRTSSTVRMQDVHWIHSVPVSEQMSCRLANGSVCGLSQKD